MCSERDNTNILNLNNGISEVTLTPGASSELHHQYNKVLCNKTAFKSNHIKRSGEVIRQPERTWIRLNLWIMYDSWTWGQYYFFLNSLCLSLSFVKWKQLKYLPKCISRTKLILTAFNCSVCRYSETSTVEGGGGEKERRVGDSSNYSKLPTTSCLNWQIKEYCQHDISSTLPPQEKVLPPGLSSLLVYFLYTYKLFKLVFFCCIKAVQK